MAALKVRVLAVQKVFAWAALTVGLWAYAMAVRKAFPMVDMSAILWVAWRAFLMVVSWEIPKAAQRANH